MTELYICPSLLAWGEHDRRISMQHETFERYVDEQKQADEIRKSEELGRAMGTVNKFLLGWK